LNEAGDGFDDGRAGNFWSEHAGYDLDGDGVSDIPHAPVTAFAFLSKQFPDLAVFGQSPATAALTMAERTIPALRPSEIVDRFPLVAPVAAAPPAPAPAPPAGSDTGGRAAAVVGFGALAMAGLVGLARRS
jgi:nitrous oxidase accessory protein